MPQIFRPESNLIFRFAILLIALLSVGLAFGGSIFQWSPFVTAVNVPLNQTVPFSHAHHVGGLGIDCRYCHASVEKAANAGMPSTHTCMSCHSQIWNGATMLAPVRKSLASMQPLVWKRVNRLPQYVYFNHSIHVTKGIGCTSCHGQIERMPLTWKARNFYMSDCLSCHREPEKNLRPESEIFSLNWNPPANQETLGASLIDHYQTPKTRLTDCGTCHR